MTTVGVICLVLMSLTGALCVVRIVRGPATLDRTVAADVFVAAMVGSMGIEAAVFRHTTTLPVLVVLAFVGFLGSVSIARFAARDTPLVDESAPDETVPDETVPDETVPDERGDGR